MQKKVLITGATGFVGSNVLEYLKKNTDWDIVSFDFRDRLVNIGKFDYILNLASESDVQRSIQSPVNFIHNNIDLILKVLEYARKYPPHVFLQFSTEEVYGATNHKEWDVQLPSNPYAASKSAQEMIAIAYWKTYRVPVVITNSSNIVGKNQRKDKFIPKIIEQIKRGEEVTIYTSGGKVGKRYWNPVNNVADAIKFILSLEPSMYPDQERLDRYDLPGGEQMDNLQMAQLVAELLNKPLKYKLIDAESIRPGYNEFYTKAEGKLIELGWKPKETLREGLLWI